VFNISCELVSLPLDTPAGEVDNYTVINCKDGEIVKMTSDTNGPTNREDEQNLVQAPEEKQPPQSSK